MNEDLPFYGYCPYCGAFGDTREVRPNGNDVCENGHRYPSASALKKNPYPKEFMPWDGQYDKQHYDVRIGKRTVYRCWPNAGGMSATDGSGRRWTMADNIEVRVSPKPENPLRPIPDSIEP